MSFEGYTHPEVAKDTGEVKPKGKTGEKISYVTKAGEQRHLNLKVKKEITSGGTHDIKGGEATTETGKYAGDYIIKKEYYEGDTEAQLLRWRMCKDAGLPVPTTFREGQNQRSEKVIIVTDLMKGNKEVWSLNDIKERPFPSGNQHAQDVQSQLYTIAEVAAKSCIELTQYSFLAIISDGNKIRMIIGDLGHTEIHLPLLDQNDRERYPQDLSQDQLTEAVKKRNMEEVAMFMRKSGLIESERTSEDNPKLLYHFDSR